MIWRLLGRALWVAVAFVLAALTGATVLTVLGGLWAGAELRAAAPGDPVYDDAGAVIGFVLFAGAVLPALTALPGLIAVLVGEVLRIRAWLYYVAAGGAAMAAVPLLVQPADGEVPLLPAADYMAVFAAAGFAAGLVYWLLAGRRA